MGDIAIQLKPLRFASGHLRVLVYGVLLTLACVDDSTTVQTTTSGESTAEGSGTSDTGAASETGDTSCETGSETESESESGDPEQCGDGAVDEGEACDDGEQNGDDQACTSACELAECGDGLLWAGVEACDDGDQNGDDQACTSACELAICGDGLVWAGQEDCDDGNLDETDACTTLCAPPSCDDGLRSGAEDYIDCGGSCADCSGPYQHVWKGAQAVPFPTWTKIDAADFEIETHGGALEIELSLPLSDAPAGHSACRPTVDDVWAGTAEGLPQAYAWHEGIDRMSIGARMWRRARVYYDIPAGAHTLGAQCLTTGGVLTVGREQGSSLIIAREYDGVVNRVHQKVTTMGSTIPVTDTLELMAGSELVVDTVGGDIEVALSVALGHGGQAACLPFMDGAPVPSSPQPYADEYWAAGAMSTWSSWAMWSHSRLYTDIPAGQHTFSIHCIHDNEDLSLGLNGIGNVLIVRELDNEHDAVAQGVDLHNDDGWKVAGGQADLWYGFPDHLATLDVVHGNVEITQFVGIYGIPEGGWFTCRPMMDGEWLGVQAGLVFESDDEEGAHHQPAAHNHHGIWQRRRIYSGISPGQHTFELQCMSTGAGYGAQRFGQGTLTARDVKLLTPL